MKKSADNSVPSGGPEISCAGKFVIVIGPGAANQVNAKNRSGESVRVSKTPH